MRDIATFSAVMPDSKPCQHCDGPAIAEMKVQRGGYVAGSDFIHEPTCRKVICPCGMRWIECVVDDHDAIRGNARKVHFHKVGARRLCWDALLPCVDMDTIAMAVRNVGITGATVKLERGGLQAHGFVWVGKLCGKWWTFENEENRLVHPHRRDDS